VLDEVGVVRLEFEPPEGRDDLADGGRWSVFLVDHLAAGE
jgi:hypothetical protein